MSTLCIIYKEPVVAEGGLWMHSQVWTSAFPHSASVGHSVWCQSISQSLWCQSLHQLASHTVSQLLAHFLVTLVPLGMAMSVGQCGMKSLREFDTNIHSPKRMNVISPLTNRSKFSLKYLNIYLIDLDTHSCEWIMIALVALNIQHVQYVHNQISAKTDIPIILTRSSFSDNWHMTAYYN